MQIMAISRAMALVVILEGLSLIVWRFARQLDPYILMQTQGHHEKAIGTFLEGEVCANSIMAARTGLDSLTALMVPFQSRGDLTQKPCRASCKCKFECVLVLYLILQACSRPGTAHHMGHLAADDALSCHRIKERMRQHFVSGCASQPTTGTKETIIQGLHPVLFKRILSTTKAQAPLENVILEPKVQVDGPKVTGTAQSQPRTAR